MINAHADTLKTMPLSLEERVQFLAEPHVAAIAVENGDGRGPLVIPIWYGYQPGGDVWIDTELESVKAMKIRAAGRFSLMVDRVTPTPRYVSIEGPVAGIDPLPVEKHRETAARYLAGSQLEGYMQWAESAMTDMVRIRMRPDHWLSADLGLV